MMKYSDPNTLKAFQHSVLCNREKQEICVLSHPNISIPKQLLNKKVVAPTTPSHRNTAQICAYYAEAKQQLQVLVIDSNSYRSHAIDASISNYYSYHMNILDIHSGMVVDCQDKLSYLLVLAELLNSDKMISIAANIAIKMIPLTYSSPASILKAYNLRGKLAKKLTKQVEQALSKSKETINSYYNLSPKLTIKNINDLQQLNAERLFADTSTVALKAKTGVGKTKHVFSPLTQSSSRSQKVVYISHLVALSEQFCKNNKAVSYSSNSLTEIENSERLSIVINSLYKPHLIKKAMEADILIIDEFEKVLSAIVSSKNKREMKSSQVHKALRIALESAQKVVVGDADLSNFSLNFLSGIRPDLICMNCSQNPYTTISAIVKAQEPLLSSQTLRESLFENKVFLFDTRATLQAAAVHMGFENEAGLECEATALESDVLIIHGKNKDMAEQKAFLANPDEEVQKYKAILASPCLSAGFSITVNYTDTVHIFCNGTLTPDELINFSRRFRSANQLVFSPNSPHKKHYDFCDLERKDDMHCLSLQYAEKKSLLNENLALSLKHLLAMEGFQVLTEQNDSVTLNSSRNVVSKTKRQLNYCRDLAVVEAKNISRTKYKELKASNKVTAIQIAQCDKFLLKETYQLPHITLEDVFFNKQFNKELFKALCSINQGIHIKLNNDPNLLKTAKILNAIILGSKEIDIKKKTNHFIEGDRCLSITHNLAKHWKVLVHFLPNLCNPKSIDTKNKATRFIKQILKSFGADLTNFSGNTNKARVTFHDNTIKYYKRLQTHKD
ncbi:TPA: hypothetical protein NGT58_003483 [Vibrio parahaemolyticus]|nr:hypothetical protein [Vibrio parahaemolyticus]